MLNAKLLSPTSTLNDFEEIGNIEYVSGENVNIKFRTFDRIRGTRYVLTNPSTVITVEIESNTGTPITKTATLIDVEDKSMYEISLTPAESATIISSSISITVDILGDGTQICKAIMYNTLTRNVISGDC